MSTEKFTLGEDGLSSHAKVGRDTEDSLPDPDYSPGEDARKETARQIREEKRKESERKYAERQRLARQKSPGQIAHENMVREAGEDDKRKKGKK